MKSTIKFLSFIFLIVLASCDTTTDPGTWFNTINDAEDRSRKAFAEIGKKMEHQEYALDETLQKAIDENNKGLEEIKALPAIEKGENYRQSVLNIMTDYDSFFSRHIPNYLRLAKDSLSEEEAANIQSEFDTALTRHQELEKSVVKEQDLFFQEFKLNQETK